MTIKYYKVIVECGYIGTKRSVEITRHICAESMGHAFSAAINMPRVKKSQKSRGCSLKECRQIQYKEYLLGKEIEANNPYLQVHKKSKKNHTNQHLQLDIFNMLCVGLWRFAQTDFNAS